MGAEGCELARIRADMGGERRRTWVIIGALVLAAAVLTSDSAAFAQDALICRKRDQQAGPGASVEHLGAGADYFNGGPGPDVIYGGPGDDIINGGRGNDRIFGGPGHDIVCGGVGRDLVDGGGGEDSVYGEEGDDTLRGGAGRDYMNGQAGRDRILGFGRRSKGPVADGVDLIEGSYRRDVILVGGHDDAHGGDGDDLIRSATPQIGAGRLDGGPDDDKIFGSEQADELLIGGQGRNYLYGGGGDDVFRGGGELSLLAGGDGADTFFLGDGGGVVDGGPGDDLCFVNGGPTPAGCDRSQALRKEETFARLEAAWSALQAARADGPKPKVAELKAILATAPPEQRIDLQVAFLRSEDEESHFNFELADTLEYDVTFLVLRGRPGGSVRNTRIGAKAYFEMLAPDGGPRCRREGQPHYNSC